MPAFPKREADILALCDAMIAGYQTHAADFPSYSPLPPWLLIISNAYRDGKDYQTEKLASAQVCTEGGGEFGEWGQAGIALETETTLMNQPRGPQLEYRVKAINTGGESMPSNTVMVVL